MTHSTPLLYLSLENISSLIPKLQLNTIFEMQDVAPLPNLDKLLALLERYLALPGELGLLGGTMTEEEQAQLLKVCPDAQPVGPGPWPTSSPAPSPPVAPRRRPLRARL